MSTKNIYRRSDGRWEARINIEKDKTSGKTRFKSFYGKTKVEAERKRAEFEKTNKINLKKSNKFSDIYCEWMADKKKKLKQSSIIAYESKAQKYILPYFGNMFYWEANSAEAGFVQKLKEDENISENFRKELVTLYRSILYWYMEEEHKVPSQKSKTEISFFTDEEMQTIAKKLNRESLDISILFYTGMTVGELSALKWDDCDLESGVIKVERNLQRVSDSTRNENSKTRLIETKILEREVPIAKNLKKILEFTPKSKRKGYVIGAGKPVEPRILQYRTNDFLEKIGFNGTPNKFRDSFAVKAIKKDINPLFIAKVMGIKAESFFKKYQVFLEETITVEKIRTVVDVDSD